MPKREKPNYLGCITPKRVYANLYFDGTLAPFTNDMFISMLKVLGRLVYNTEDPNNLNEVFGALKEEYNRINHFNRVRNHDKRLSCNQIRSLTRSFDVFPLFRHRDEVLVRIPFATVPILDFILSKYQSVMKTDSTIYDKIKDNSIGKVLCGDHIRVARIEMGEVINASSDEEYIQKCRNLEKEMLDAEGLLNMNWHVWESDKGKSVEKHWKMYKR